MRVAGALIAIALVTTGCGTDFRFNARDTALGWNDNSAMGSALGTSGGTSSNIPSRFSPAGVVIEPDSISALKYSVWINSSDATEIWLEPRSSILSGSVTACVFPIEELSNGSKTWKSGTYGGDPLSKCFPLTGDGAAFQFSKVGYNAAITVSGSSREIAQLQAQMTRCLKIGIPYYCPEYGYARFR